MPKSHVRFRAVCVSVSAVILCSCAASLAAATPPWDDLLLAPQQAASESLPPISPPAAVFVGEVHDSLPYHVNQLAVIKTLRERGLPVAIGLEMIQTPFQDALDAYLDRTIDFGEMLERTEYYMRWRFDARLYQPIFEYARQHELPLVALNAAREVTDRVRRVGIDGLDAGDRALMPKNLTPLASGYRDMLERVFEEHRGENSVSLERFIDVQRTWDETMAKQASDFLKNDTDRVLVVLAGVQHVANGYGIPRRVAAHADVPVTVVLSDAERDLAPDSADVYLELVDQQLPAPGRMGVLIKPAMEGVIVDGFADGSPAKQAGMKAEDRIVEINGRSVDRFADVKLALWDKMPGDVVSLTVSRGPGPERVELGFGLY